MADYGYSVSIKNDCPWSFTTRNFYTQGTKFTTNNLFFDLNRFSKFNNYKTFDFYGKNLYASLGLDINTKAQKLKEPQGASEDSKTDKTSKADKPAGQTNVSVGDNNGTTVIIIGNGNKVVIGKPDKPQKPDKTKKPDKAQKPEEPPVEKPEEPTIEKVNAKVTAKDIELLKKRGADLNHNDKYGKAQFVEGSEVYISGQDKTKPDTIIAKDTTNHAEGNTYTYKKVEINDKSKELFAKYGLDLDMSQFKEGETYYFLETSENGRTGEKLYNIDGAKHLEIYKLELVQNDDGTFEYNLVQEKGMQGSNQSSISYGKRF